MNDIRHPAAAGSTGNSFMVIPVAQTVGRVGKGSEYASDCISVDLLISLQARSGPCVYLLDGTWTMSAAPIRSLRRTAL